MTLTTKTFCKSISLLLGLTMIAALVACGGGSSSTTTPPPPTISVAFSPAAPASLTTNATQSLTAVVANDSASKGVTWTVTCGSSGACGSFNPTSTASGSATTYTAPAAAPTGNTVTVTATSVSDTTKSASATITITVPVVITVSLSGAPSTLNTGATVAITATTNDTAGVTWSVTCGSTGACGSFNPTSTLTGVATTYTAPSAIPTGNTATVTATSVTNTAVSASATITITLPGPIAVTFSPTPPTSIVAGATQSLTAVVANDPANAGVTWTVTCGSAGACGSFNPTATASGVATTYTAPSAVPTGNTVTVKATSVTDATKSASATITIKPITVTLSGVPSTLPTSATAMFSATTNDTAGVDWTVTCGSTGACGGFNPTSTLTTVDTTYTAPSAIPSGSKVTVIATSVTDPTKSASAKITITAAILADGSYVFALGGTNGTGGAGSTPSPYFVAGQFVVSGGLITGGEQDFLDFNSDGPNTDLINSTGSTIATTADGNIQIKLTTCNGLVCTGKDTIVGVSGVETINASLVSTTKALIIEYDSSAASSGTIDLQTSTAAPSGGYAFSVNGLSSGAFPLAIGGVINVDNNPSPGDISGAGSIFDLNNRGALSSNQTFKASTVTTPDSAGRVVFTLNPTSSSLLEFSLVGYLVDTTHVRLVEGSDALGAVTGGTALVQGANTGTFTSASISGDSYVAGLVGADINGVLQVAGLLTANSGGTVGGTISYNDLTQTASANPITGGTYTVASTGQVVLSGITDGTVTYDINLYIDGNGNAVSITPDTAHILAGGGYQQSGTFTASSFSGTYAVGAGGVDKTNKNEFNSVGPVTADGVSALSGFADLNYLKTGTVATQSTDLIVTGAFTAATNGVFTGTITGLDVTTKTNTDAFTYYLVDSTRLFAIETDANQLTLGYFELTQ